MYNWDYDLPKNWKPKTDAEWEWYLVRKINYDNWDGIKKRNLKDYFNHIADKLDTGKRKMIISYFEHNA